MNRRTLRLATVFVVAGGLITTGTLIGRALVLSPSNKAPVLYTDDLAEADPPEFTVTVPDFFGDFTGGAPSQAQTTQANSVALSDSPVQQAILGEQGRVIRRLQSVEGWSHGTTEQGPPGSP
ncbi:MAG: hypothetical protein ABR552_08585 [Actinomycetota bacterium]